MGIDGANGVAYCFVAQILRRICRRLYVVYIIMNLRVRKSSKFFESQLICARVAIVTKQSMIENM